MVEGTSRGAGTRKDGRDLETLHYELAAQVDALRDNLKDTNNNLTALSVEMRLPRPIPWGVIATVCGTIAAVLLSIGGLVHMNISQRIEDNKASLTHHDRMSADRMIESDARLNKKLEAMMPRVEAESAIGLLRETARRLEEVQITQRKMEHEITVSKAEFLATISAIQSRMQRNEGYIEEARKGETLHARINQLYELYRQMQSQQIQLHKLSPAKP